MRKPMKSTKRFVNSLNNMAWLAAEMWRRLMVMVLPLAIKSSF
jgi:hypothetical protein